MELIRCEVVFDGRSFLTGGASVLVDQGRIAGVEPLGFVPPGGWTVTAHDGTLLPGLIDTHTHLVGSGRPNALEFVAGYSDDEVEAVVTESLSTELSAGVTSVRDLGDRRFNVADRRKRPGEPRVVASGPPLTTVSGHCHYLGGEVTGADQIRRSIAEHVEHGVDVIKVMASGGTTTVGTDVLAPQFLLDDLRLMVELAHAAGLPLTAHAHALAAVRLAVDAGVDGIEHCTCLTETGPVADPALFDAIAAADITVCTTQGGDLRKVGVPPPPIRAMLDRLGLTVDQLYAGRQATVAGLHRAGVRLTCGVDSGLNPIKCHGTVALSVGDHLEAGIPLDIALGGATSIAAEVCGIGDSKGRIETDYDADLLLVGGDIRADISALQRVTSVWLAGEQVRGRRN